MSQILSQFGVQPILLAAQVVNFLILLFILQRFLYKPILKVLKARQNRIAESLRQADEIEERLKKSTEEQEKQMLKALKEAEDITTQASQAANQIIADARQKAEEDIKTLIAKNEQSMKLEREKLHQEIRSELADMVVLSLEKITGKMLNAQDHRKIIKQSLEELNG